MAEFNREIKSARERLYPSARNFAHRHQWDERTWARIESGERQSFSPDELKKIATDLKIKIQFGGNEND